MATVTWSNGMVLTPDNLNRQVRGSESDEFIIYATYDSSTGTLESTATGVSSITEMATNQIRFNLETSFTEAGAFFVSIEHDSGGWDAPIVTATDDQSYVTVLTASGTGTYKLHLLGVGK